MRERGTYERPPPPILRVSSLPFLVTAASLEAKNPPTWLLPFLVTADFDRSTSTRQIKLCCRSIDQTVLRVVDVVDQSSTILKGEKERCEELEETVKEKRKREDSDDAGEGKAETLRGSLRVMSSMIKNKIKRTEVHVELNVGFQDVRRGRDGQGDGTSPPPCGAKSLNRETIHDLPTRFTV